MTRPRQSFLSSPAGLLWGLRILWVALGPLTALALDGALADVGGTGRTVATVWWWIAVAGGVVALVVPSTVGLTAMRMLVPVTVPIAAAALIGGGGAAAGGVALAVALLATAAVCSGEVGEAFVQASAYGHEQRFPLRVPAPVLPAAALVWLVWAAAMVAAAIVLANEVWVAGAVVAAAAAALTWPAARRLHTLSRRWLVLVPAGVVLHDGLVLGETLMVAKPNVSRARLAPAGTQALDLTGPAGGHAIEITVREMALAHLAATRAEPTGKAVHVQAYLIAPARPGRALQAMGAAKVPVG